MAFLRLLVQIGLSLTLLLFITTTKALTCPKSIDFISKKGLVYGWYWGLPSGSSFVLGESSPSLYFFSPGPRDGVFPPDTSLITILSSFTDRPDGKTTSAMLFCQYTLPNGAYFYVHSIHKIFFSRIEKNRIMRTWKIDSKSGIDSIQYNCTTTVDSSSVCEINV